MNFQRPGSRGTPLKASLFTLGAALAALIVTAQASAQDLVALRSSATLEGTGAIRLDQVAEVSGPGAERLSAVVLDSAELVQDKQGWVVIDLERVRRTLEKLGTENWGRLTLRGSVCNARRVLEAPAPTPAPEAATPAVPEGQTVRGLVKARLSQVLDAEEENLKLVFDEGDSKLLDTATAGLVADVQLVGSSERQPVSVRLYRDQTTVASGQVRVHVGVKRRVAVAVGGLRRGQALGESTFITEERWVGPTVRPADAEGVLGQFARGRISPGQVIEVTDVEPPVVIRKGELADVVCLSGGVSVKVKARALEPGRLGDRIGFQLVDSTRNFRARVDGPSRAITGADKDAGQSSGDTRGMFAAQSPARSGVGAVHSSGAAPGGPTPIRKQTSGLRELARAAAREADRRRNLYLDLGDRRLDAGGTWAGNVPPASVRSGAFELTRGTPGDPAQAALDRLLTNPSPSEDRP